MTILGTSRFFPIMRITNIIGGGYILDPLIDQFESTEIYNCNSGKIQIGYY